MIEQWPDGTWWIASELGPEDCPPRRQISEEEARVMIADIEQRDLARRISLCQFEIIA